MERLVLLPYRNSQRRSSHVAQRKRAQESVLGGVMNTLFAVVGVGLNHGRQEIPVRQRVQSFVDIVVKDVAMERDSVLYYGLFFRRTVSVV
jgi:hypothetical protein